MITDICRDYLAHLATKDKVELGPATGEGRSLVSELGRNAVELSLLFSSCWPLAPIGAGPFTLLPVNELAADSDNRKLIADGYVCIGNASNGDLLVVTLSAKNVLECEVGVLSHDKLWSGDATTKDCYVPICSDLLDFLNRAVEGDYLPRDFCMAAEHNKVRKRRHTE